MGLSCEGGRMRRKALTGSMSAALEASSLDEEAIVSLEMSLTDCILRISEVASTKALGRGVTVAGSASVRLRLGCGVALEAREERTADLIESEERFGMAADCRWGGRIRFEESELVMLFMLVREGRRCMDLGLGVARPESFSPSGVACLEAALTMIGE